MSESEVELLRQENAELRAQVARLEAAIEVLRQERADIAHELRAVLDMDAGH